VIFIYEAVASTVESDFTNVKEGLHLLSWPFSSSSPPPLMKQFTRGLNGHGYVGFSPQSFFDELGVPIASVLESGKCFLALLFRKTICFGPPVFESEFFIPFPRSDCHPPPP